MNVGSRSLAGASLAILASLPGAAQAPEPGRRAAAASLSRPLVAEGDAHYERRQEGHLGSTADPAAILAAISSYEAASRTAEDAEARWKLARALYFRGTYTGLPPGARRAIYDQARRVSEEAIAILSRRDGFGRPGPLPASVVAAMRADHDVAAAFFWNSVAWGQWALAVGKLQAARLGAATKIRDAAQLLIAIDPEFEEGGGYRILGRLHDQAPRIPMLTWWVSRKDALANLRRAVAVGPGNPINLHFLAEALWRGAAAEKAEAIQLEEQVVAAPDSPTHLVEELNVQDEARRNLARWRK